MNRIYKLVLVVEVSARSSFVLSMSVQINVITDINIFVQALRGGTGLPRPGPPPEYAEIWLGRHQPGSAPAWGTLQLVLCWHCQCSSAPAHASATGESYGGDQRYQWPDIYS